MEKRALAGEPSASAARGGAGRGGDGFLRYAAYVAARTTGATNIGLSAVNETTLVWLAVVVLATGIGAFFGYNVSLVRNGPVLTSASLDADARILPRCKP